MNILAPKIEALHRGPKTNNCDFLKNDYRWYLQENNGMPPIGSNTCLVFAQIFNLILQIIKYRIVAHFAYFKI
jgi:hypothetical protein